MDARNLLASRQEEAERDRETVEALRAGIAARRGTATAVPTVRQVRAISQCIQQGKSVHATADTVGQTVEFVLDVVAVFGTWLVHVLRPTVEPVRFQIPFELEINGMTAEGETSSRKLGGYEPQSVHRRDVTGALSAIRAIKPDSEITSRFVARTYATRSASITYPLVAGVWGQVVRDRLTGLELVSDNLEFLSLALDAYDLLDVARADGVDALRTLCDSDGSDTTTVLSAAAACQWLAEAPVRSIARAASLAETSDVARERLRKDLRYFTAMVQEQPLDYLPSGVRHLNLGHVQRICAAAGIRIEAGNQREEAEIRAALKDMGLSSDTDRLVHDALRLAEAGLIDEFWDVMGVRIDGDPAWVGQLSTLLAKA